MNENCEYSSTPTVDPEDLSYHLRENLSKEKIDFNDTVRNRELVDFLHMEWVNKLSIIDWGKTVSIPNQEIGRDILNRLLPNGYKAFTTDDSDCPIIDTSNNSPGFDIIIKDESGDLKRVQSKLRQVNGVPHYSKQVGIETTRRNSAKNKGKNHTGHVCYSCDEFDYVLISAINVKNDYDNRHDINTWGFSIIPIKELIDSEKGCCVTKITPKILNKYKINY